MSYGARVAVACSGLACAIFATHVRAEDARELKIIASAQDSTRAVSIGPVLMEAPGGYVIRSAEQLVALSTKADSAKDRGVQKEIEAELARLLRVDAIDWSKQMAVAVRGEPGTKADTIRFDSIKVADKVLTVAWKVRPRPPHAGPGTPIAVILVERFDGEVRFALAGQK
jgi:hypothetical protein